VKNNLLNSRAILSVAEALGELNDRVIFVGGAVVGLYINDPAADDVRPTKDVDISLDIVSAIDLENLRMDLVRRGFQQTSDDDVMCRFRYNGIAVDVMSTRGIGWAPANPWFAPGVSRAETILLDGMSIRILSLPYFLATKLSAYHERGKNDPRTSHDLEDVIYLLDNRIDIVETIERSDSLVHSFLSKEFYLLQNDPRFIEAIRGNISRKTQTERFAVIIQSLRRISHG
jgi:predicted nucleotidyltransferase